MKKRSTTTEPAKNSKGIEDTDRKVEMHEAFDTQLERGTFFDSLYASGHILDNCILEKVAKEAWSKEIL